MLAQHLKLLVFDLDTGSIATAATPIFTSDDRDAYKNALVEVYGVDEQPEYKGRRRSPNPKKVPPPDLKYAQVVKYRGGDEVTDVKKRIVSGTISLSGMA